MHNKFIFKKHDASKFFQFESEHRLLFVAVIPAFWFPSIRWTGWKIWTGPSCHAPIQQKSWRTWTRRGVSLAAAETSDWFGVQSQWLSLSSCWSWPGARFSWQSRWVGAMERPVLLPRLTWLSLMCPFFWGCSWKAYCSAGWWRGSLGSAKCSGWDSISSGSAICSVHEDVDSRLTTKEIRCWCWIFKKINVYYLFLNSLFLSCAFVFCFSHVLAFCSYFFFFLI